jgi:DNA end-binding protein Ku
MAARAIGSGTISFGLVSIPFKLYTAASSQNISFNLLHKKCGGRMKQQYQCPVDNCIVERTDMVKGYEFAKDQYVQFSEDELKKLDAAKSDALELVEFVPESTVDLVYMEKSYYIGPDKGGDKAYQLLAQAMKRSGKIAVGRYNTRGREQLVLIRPYHEKGLIMHYVYYASEVRSFDEVGVGSTTAFKDVELDLADKLIEQLTTTEFKADKYRDEYQDRVKHAVDQKVAGKEITVAEEAPKAQIIDLFEALKRSLASGAAPPSAKAENKDEAPESAKPVKKASPRESKKKAGTG